MRSSRSRSVIDRYCLNPAIWSRTVRPSGVGAEIHQKAETTSGRASAGSSSGSHQPVFSASREDRQAERRATASADESDQGQQAFADRGIVRREPQQGGDEQRAENDADACHDLTPPVAATTAAAASHSRGREQQQPGAGPAVVAVEQLAFVANLQNLRQAVLRRREILVVLLLHHDRFAGPAELVERGLLFLRKVALGIRAARAGSSCATSQPPSSSTMRMWPRTPMSTSAAAKARLSALILVT